jgi:hypothetical protein
MANFFIQLTLLSDTTFSRGDGVAGLLDREVEHDELGLPYLHGRTLKGLLGEEADNLLDYLAAMNIPLDVWEAARQTLFGSGGSKLSAGAKLHYSHAQLPPGVRDTVRLTLEKATDNRLIRQDVLAALTAVRRQTAVNGDGLPHDGSLRSMRVILRQTVFTAELTCGRDMSTTELALLSAAVLALRRAGTGRNRGRGQLQADLLDAQGRSVLQTHYDAFTQALAEVAA